MTEYLKRLQRFGNITILSIRENKSTTQKILDVIGNSFCIILDEGGKSFSSKQLATFLEKKKNQSLDIAFVIGGPDGHSDTLYKRADMKLSLSALTFPHDIATLLLTETLYRSLTILEGHPYHRS